MGTIIFFLLIITLWIISKFNQKVKFWVEKIIQQPFNYYLLIGLLIVGFFFRLDYSDRFGCIIFEEPIFEFKNILFSAISITLVLLSFFSKKRTFKLTFISLELLFWIAKLFLFKGGYAVGFLNTADTYISFYDTTTLALRLFIINSLLNTKIHQIYILICTLIIMSVKIYCYPVPYSFFVEQRKFEEQSENIKTFFAKSEWIENKDTTRKIRVFFNPESVVIYHLQDNDELVFDRIWWFKDKIFLESSTDFGNSCFFDFYKISEDTLKVNFRYRDNEDYKTLMIRR